MKYCKKFLNLEKNVKTAESEKIIFQTTNIFSKSNYPFLNLDSIWPNLIFSSQEYIIFPKKYTYFGVNL